jgi:hypothetical protein
MFVTIKDAYEEFERMHGTERPLWSCEDLRTWIHSEKLLYQDITADDLGRAIDVEIAEMAAAD